ncbi:MAG: fibronectin type III domain-containing protein, partial [Bacteroidetes bacterium]|nr:fibronectin type III domain-containing protein [Bacteroidota bacterium]
MKAFFYIISFVIVLISPCVYPQCTYRIELYDTYGDGWTGGTVSVLLNDIPVLTDLTLQTGSGPESHDFIVTTGDLITTTYTPGNWPYENEYYIFNADGIQIFGDGLNGTTPSSSGSAGTAFCSSCPVPSGLDANDITDSSAMLSWQDTGTPDYYDLQWGLNGFTPGSGTLVTGLNDSFYDLNGLSVSTAYSFYVRSACNGGDTSAWAGPFGFITTCPGTMLCTYTLNMTDEGNSWNGATITLVQDDIMLGQYTVTGGGSNLETVSLCSGTTIEMVWSSGLYDNETIFEMTDPEGSVVFSWPAGGAPDPGVFYTFTSSCIPQTCPAPAGLAASGITDSSAFLSWSETGVASAWNIEFGPAGFTQGTGTLITGLSSQIYQLSGLGMFTEYGFYAQSDCGDGDLSNWTGPESFITTLASLSNPTDCQTGIAIPDGDCVEIPVNVAGPAGQLGVNVTVD